MLYLAVSKKEFSMYATKQKEQGINTLSQADYLPILIDSFLIDRKDGGKWDANKMLHQNLIGDFLSQYLETEYFGYTITKSLLGNCK